MRHIETRKRKTLKYISAQTGFDSDNCSASDADYLDECETTGIVCVALGSFIGTKPKRPQTPKRQTKGPTKRLLKPVTNKNLKAENKSDDYSGSEDGRLLFTFGPYASIKFVGLSKADNQRSCAIHDICGAALQVGDILTFVRADTIDEIDGRMYKDAMLAVKVIMNSLMLNWYRKRAVSDSLLITFANICHSN
jgi:hypothetical protein